MELGEIKEITRKIVFEIITTNSETDEKPTTFEDDDSLIDAGLIDSIGAVQLIEECVQKFDVLIHPAELSLENFDTVNRICQFIQTKLMESQQWA
ncbi:MAG TPA: phosphopantetheine-binding protein [Thermodesulfobacteriota bacterium]|nr:phosphopantetheine-binding protein [Thermodesulfobacteriota bacterium]